MAALSSETLVEVLGPLRSAPERAAILVDVDGTLAPIVDRPEEARVPRETSTLLAALGRRYATVACVSGRSAAEARRLVGVGSIAYAGTHGAELLDPGPGDARFLSDFAAWREPVAAFVAEQEGARMRTLRVRSEDKGPIQAFHWRGAPDEAAAAGWLEDVAAAAADRGLAVHWGRKVLEIRPPVAIGKGRAVRELVERAGVDAALYAGDDVTDLDGFTALDEMLDEGLLTTALRVGVRSEEGPTAIVERADVVAEGVEGFVSVLEALAES